MRNFRPDLKEARRAMKAKDTLRIDLTKLRLQGGEEEWRYLEIGTTDYDKLNAEERKLAERFYGQGEQFDTAMRTLYDAGSVTQVYVLNPSYVQEEAKKGPVGRAAWRLNFYCYAYSDAYGCDVNKHGGLLGVRRVVAPAGARAGK